MQEDNATQKMSVQSRDKSAEEIDVLQEEFSQKCRICKDVSALWQELQREAKLGVSDIKLTSKDEDKRVIEYIRSHKTEDTYAFSREEISEATGIPLSTLPYTTIAKIPSIRFILIDGKLWFTTVTLKERLTELLKN